LLFLLCAFLFGITISSVLDPQGSLTISLGNPQPDQLPTTLATIMGKVLNEETIVLGEGLLHHDEGVDLMPANIELSGMEVSLVNAMSRRQAVFRTPAPSVFGRYH
jgi:cellulose biosynthesis protein BcsQ